MIRRFVLSLCVSVLLAACAQEAPPAPPQPSFIADGRPEMLSDWGQLAVGGGVLVLGDQVTPYTLATGLFTDYAQKLRTVWIPASAGPAGYDPEVAFDFPVGTVITKTFYYPRATGGFERVLKAGPGMAHYSERQIDLDAVRLIETRVLVHRETGWETLPYVWNDDQTEARLSRAGAFVDLTLVSEAGEQALGYLVPNVNQCAGCHETDTTDGVGARPIGPRARHMNTDFEYFDGVANQIDHWSELGLLAGAPASQDAPRNASWHGELPLAGVALDEAARAYLDINCSHCHSRTGPGDTSGLYLEASEPVGPHLGVCKLPIAAGRGTGNRRYDIVPGASEESILSHRLASVQSDVMMPELGRALSHDEGVALIAAWIDAMSGGCG
ncbi:SO2930 family diheme c-type cytochrome [Oceanicaulis sp.]|uniref:SO2930 family diheme c-type cytochrome n=1 Tax=Oceanicaulis sp. TaxID=1924941 RepID=UPI003F70F66D